MSITPNDIRFYQSARMTDNPDGGGRMSSVVVVDGVDNNCFPDVDDIERLTGRINVRKLFAAALNNNNDVYLSAHVILDDAPDDAATEAVMFRAGAYTSVFDDIDGMTVDGGTAGTPAGATWTGGDVVYNCTTHIEPGGHLVVYTGTPSIYTLRTVVSRSGDNMTVDAALPGSGSVTGFVLPFSFTGTGTRFYGVAQAAGSTSSGATSIVAGSKVMARILPIDLAAAYPSSVNAAWSPSASLASALFSGLHWTHGRVRVIAPDDIVLVHSTQSMAPATVSNGQTKDTLRTTLARLRVIGNNGVEHARFTRGVTPPTGVGCAADLDAGTVTFSDVSGMSQPVTVEHRIEEMAIATAVELGSGKVSLNRALSRAYPAGTKVSSLIMLGDMQGRVQEGFPQQAWTGTFSDSVSGGTPTADFNESVYPITTTNKGAITERWAIIFNSGGATFRCIGEGVGEITSGGTGADFSPVNPATGAPYFTITAAGWGTGWSTGNVYRFNTTGANAPLWLLRAVAPSTPSGSDSVTPELRGYVNT